MKLKIFALLAIACMAVCAQASVVEIGPSVILQDLIDGTATISAGDKTFTDFSYAQTGDVPAPSNVNVIPIEDCDGNYGIRFQGAFVDLPGNNGSDALITYNVHAPGPFITGAALQANTTVSGGGIAQISETFLSTFTDVVLNVFDNGVNPPQLFDSVDFNTSADWTGPVMTLPVQKDILLRANDNGGIAATISFIDQIYYQVPEPTSVALMVCGLALLGLRRRG